MFRLSIGALKTIHCDGLIHVKSNKNGVCVCEVVGVRRGLTRAPPVMLEVLEG